MMGVSLELFIVGITLSFGPCLLICSPLVIPYITATQKGWREGLRAVLIFSFSRLTSCVVLGLLAGMLGRLFVQQLDCLEKIIFSGGGIFICLVGLFIIFSRDSRHRFCQFLMKHPANNTPALILFGLIVGILPCVPLLGILTYITLKAKSPWQGAFYGFSFGMGELLSPLILFGVLAGALPAMVKNSRIYSFLTRGCGVLLFFLGVQLVISRLLR